MHRKLHTPSCKQALLTSAAAAAPNRPGKCVYWSTYFFCSIDPTPAWACCTPAAGGAAMTGSHTSTFCLLGTLWYKQATLSECGRCQAPRPHPHPPWLLLPLHSLSRLNHLDSWGCSSSKHPGTITINISMTPHLFAAVQASLTNHQQQQQP